jgi:ABC-type nickel/cobalt efflux system permease component RcnA
VITVALGASTAAAHPLGNFSVNHAHALRFTPDRIIDDAVIDAAEIPTAQAERAIDTDGDGSTSPQELSSYGQDRCEALRAEIELTVDDRRVPFTLTDTKFEHLPGAAGLTTSRLECRLEAEVDLTRPRDVQFLERFETTRVGWREITAVGEGVRLVASPVPTRSTTDGLRDYPVDLLSSPLDVRDASFATAPGAATTDPRESGPQGPESEQGRSLTEGGPLARLVDDITGVFDDLVGRRDLTLGVGLVAVALAIVLGASHALLPGHGKTVMAAYIAGRQGTARDAIVVGATVTATHTGGVLVLGLALTISSSLAGETVLAWLGITSGLLIAVLGASLLIGSVRHRPSALHHGHSHHGHSHHGHGHHAHSHHDHSHHEHSGHEHGSHEHGIDDHDTGRDHTDDHADRRRSSPGHLVAATNSRSDPADGSPAAPSVVRRTVVARRSNGHAVALAERPRSARTPTVIARSQTSAVRSPHVDRRVSRRALVGMGVAGGLVPSPSALIVLLSAIALGRTAFGILLVIGYGVGMAGTLTAAGLLLVRIRDRYQRRAAGRAGRRIGAAAARWQIIMPYFTACLVLLVGLGLALRSVNQLS